MSVYVLAFGGTTPVGNFFAGSFTEVYGPSIGFLMCGAVAGILILAIITWIIFRKHRSALAERVNRSQ